ncbi:MAG: hypothetical protein HY042_04850 [Spirochaetia bacterium]|nr:hypothetical protein [Spirochaetia bacterium]
MAALGKYTFLEVLKEADAIARGANLSDKINHAVYKTIKQCTSAESAKKGGLFTITTNVPEIINLTKKDLIAVINRLIADKVVIQLFRLEYDKGSNSLKVVPCFICYPTSERESPLQLYGDVNESSMRALDGLLDARPPFDQAAFYADLENDLASDKMPDPRTLSHTVVDIFSGIHASKFDIIPPAELINGTLKELEEELVFRGKVARVVDYGLVPIRESEIMDRYETAADVFLGKVVDRHAVKGGAIRREFEPINTEEALYYADPHAVPTVDFTIRKAQVLKKTVLANPTRGAGVRYPGALTVELLLNLEAKARTRYQDKWRVEQNQHHQEFKRKLMHSATWLDAIAFFTEEKAQATAPEFWKRITNDKDLIHGTWEEPTTTVHVFVRNDQSAFRILVRGMADLPPSQHWQILAMKSTLEDHEDRYRELFEDPEFVSQYGSLLRIAYMDYIPWFFRLLLQFGIKLFLDRSFRIAKAKIQREQEGRAGRNREQAQAVRAAREEELKTAVDKARSTAMTIQVYDVLDRFYLQENKIPTVSDVRSACSDVPPEAFLDLLKSQKFQIAGASTSMEDGILLYPLNHEWRTRVARLRRVFDRIEKQGKDEELQSRLKKIRKYMSRIGPGAEPAESDDDPYERFGREVQKVKEKEARAQKVSVGSGDELDV